MEARLIFSPFSYKLPSTSLHKKYLQHLSPIHSTLSPNNNSPQETNPPTSPNIRYKVGSRRQQIKQEKQKKEEEKDGGLKKKKTWDEMMLSEKAMEIYVGEKGMLFWLNKLAYASIFVVIGGWIIFRFVGPYLGLYQLDTPPLSPTSIFKNG